MRKYLDSYLNLVKEFDLKKNSPLRPKDLSYGSNKKVWWKCIKGHEWKTTISNRTNKTNGTNCPYCSNKKVSKENNLKFLFPEIAKEWHPTKNGNLTSEDVTKGSNKKVWWKCIKGHEWQKTIYEKTQGNKCPICNSFNFVFPNIAKEWHPTKNGNLTSEDVTQHSGKIVWWKCIKGHEWKVSVNNRSRGNNCPHCYNIKRKFNTKNLIQ